MALKSDRYELQTDISFFCNAAVDRGGVVVYQDGTALGAAMDSGAATVASEVGDTNSRPVGILLNDVVDKDLTRTHLNQHKDEVQKGGKVTVLRKGYVVTDQIDSNVTVAAGEPAYLSELEAGKISNVTGSGFSDLLVGRFMSAADADGYAKVEVNLP